MDNFPSQRPGANFKREQQADGRWVIIYAPNGWDESDKTKRGLTVVKPGQSIVGKGTAAPGYEDEYLRLRIGKGTASNGYKNEYLKLRQEHYNFLKKHDDEHNTNLLKDFIEEEGVPIEK
jgi:hypothetical protein